jgi:hypothetical protein
VLIGLAGGLGFAGYRFVAGPPIGDTDANQRFDAIVLGAGLVGALVLALLGLTRGTAGIGSGLLTGPVAAVTTGVVFLAYNAVLGDNPLPLAAHVVGGAMVAGFVLTPAAALVGLVPVPPLGSTALVAGVAVVLGGLTTTLVVAERAALVPGLSALVPGYSEVGGGPVDPGQPALQPPVIRDLYPTVVARDLLERRLAEVAAFQQLRTDNPPGAVAVARIRADILPQVREIFSVPQAVPLDDTDVKAVHAHAVAGAEDHLRAFELFATALEQGDRDQFDQAQKLLLAGDSEWQAWAAGVQTL